MDKPPKRIAKTNAEKAMLTVDSALVNLWSTACNNKNVGGIEGSVKLHPHDHDLTPLG